MDSLTQIVLGAACGEAVLGKKIGNKALLFGAIGGTIPDLDVFIGGLLYKNEIDAMLFHRGFMHSIFFAIIGAFLIGWLTHKIYERSKKMVWLKAVFSFFGQLIIGKFFFRIYSKYKDESPTTSKDWVLLFFWSLFTHPILDCFTPYGTQLFAPISNYRVAFNNIAVADPLYTIPFLLSMIVLMFYKRQNSRRRLWLKIGIGMSSIYLLCTIVNKFYMDHVFKSSLEEKGIVFDRFSTQPTILNNILWYGIAETDNAYHVAFYSLLDTSNRFSEWRVMPKIRDLTPEYVPDLKNLTWFSNDYYDTESIVNNEYVYYDLRYPLVKTRTGYKPVFNLKLYRTGNRLDMKPFTPEMDDFKYTMNAL